MPDYQAPLEQLRDSYNARDPDGFAAVWNSDCEWHPFLTAREEGDPGYHGYNGIRAWFEDVDEIFEHSQVELDQYRLVGDRLLVLGRMSAKRRSKPEPTDTEVGWVIEPRGDRFQRGWSYPSHAEAERSANEAVS